MLEQQALSHIDRDEKAVPISLFRLDICGFHEPENPAAIDR
jgi:hypothetical protein